MFNIIKYKMNLYKIVKQVNKIILFLLINNNSKKIK